MLWTWAIRSNGWWFNNNQTFLTLIKLFGFSVFFLKLFFRRIEWNVPSITTYYNKSLISISILYLYILNFYLLITYPVLLNIQYQYYFNILIFYLIKSFKGLSFYINKPIYRRSRGRTFKNKINKIFRLSNYWF